MTWEDRFKAGCSIAIVVVLTWGVVLLFRGEERETKYGKASWYSTASCKEEGTSGVWTASNERFYDDQMTCAIRSREFGKIYIVTNLDNDKQVAIWHNDYGPAKYVAKRGVIIDLSKGAFNKIADLDKGVIRVKVEEFK